MQGDLWLWPSTWKVITTNGSVRKDGYAVMGRGVALEATKRFPDIQRRLGRAILRGGNAVVVFPEYHIICMPVKHKWYEPADLDLIKSSVLSLKLVADAAEHVGLDHDYAMVRLGCGNGQLNWCDVKPVIEPYLDGRFYVVERNLWTV